MNKLKLETMMDFTIEENARYKAEHHLRATKAEIEFPAMCLLDISIDPVGFGGCLRWDEWMDCYVFIWNDRYYKVSSKVDEDFVEEYLEREKAGDTDAVLHMRVVAHYEINTTGFRIESNRCYLDSDGCTTIDVDDIEDIEIDIPENLCDIATFDDLDNEKLVERIVENLNNGRFS
jgi:hypothetical protein